MERSSDMATEYGSEPVGRMHQVGLHRADRNELIVSYMLLRKSVGWIGTLLPAALLAGNAAVFKGPLPDSMSGYYYTHMRNIFVGALCALGVFLVAYDGYDEVDRWITNIAGLSIVGVALCPTRPPVAHLSSARQAAGGFHVFFAAVAFIALGLMALRFAKSQPTPGGQGKMGGLRHGLGFARPGGGGLPPRKKRRNAVYRTCGITILAGVLLAALSNILPAPVKSHWPVLFVFEALAVVAFGISWFVKGQTLLPALRDDPAEPGAVTTDDVRSSRLASRR
jgi:hypothetical protein